MTLKNSHRNDARIIYLQTQRQIGGQLKIIENQQYKGLFKSLTYRCLFPLGSSAKNKNQETRYTSGRTEHGFSLYYYKIYNKTCAIKNVLKSQQTQHFSAFTFIQGVSQL